MRRRPGGHGVSKKIKKPLRVSPAGVFVGFLLEFPDEIRRPFGYSTVLCLLAFTRKKLESAAMMYRTRVT